ncbi:hypothetical protein KBC04_00740 [Candidatus Babeliales bacterium]|nr:hypothetical protein [Candidatus Babeliales bacterium]MBP9843382.1 hypothetical protein [Candidatus Babeliales bacterium]
MKQYITMQKTKKYEMYKSLQAGDYRFCAIWRIVSDDFEPGKLIEWLMDDTKTCEGNEFIDITKERGIIALYYIYDKMTSDEDAYVTINNMCDPTNCFDMSVKNFAEIVFEWEKLRVSKPDTILIVIHEDNHVSLETDPKVIKEYQDAGYAFNIKTAPKRMEEYICYRNMIIINQRYLDSTGAQNSHCKINTIVETIQEKHFPNRRNYYFQKYAYYNRKEDIFYFGHYKQSYDGTWSPDEADLAKYVNAENSCKISRLNFLEFEQQWLELEKKEELDFCVLVYQNSEGWICCKDFKDQQAMYDFMREPFEV